MSIKITKFNIWLVKFSRILSSETVHINIELASATLFRITWIEYFEKSNAIFPLQINEQSGNGLFYALYVVEYAVQMTNSINVAPVIYGCTLMLSIETIESLINYFWGNK